MPQVPLEIQTIKRKKWKYTEKKPSLLVKCLVCGGIVASSVWLLSVDRRKNMKEVQGAKQPLYLSCPTSDVVAVWCSAGVEFLVYTVFEILWFLRPKRDILVTLDLLVKSILTF